MFIGRLGRKRTFLVEPRGEEVELPSDLKGITTLTYKYEPKIWPLLWHPPAIRCGTS